MLEVLALMRRTLSEVSKRCRLVDESFTKADRWWSVIAFPNEIKDSVDQIRLEKWVENDIAPLARNKGL